MVHRRPPCDSLMSTNCPWFFIKRAALKMLQSSHLLQTVSFFRHYGNMLYVQQRRESWLLHAVLRQHPYLNQRDYFQEWNCISCYYLLCAACKNEELRAMSRSEFTNKDVWKVWKTCIYCSLFKVNCFMSHRKWIYLVFERGNTEINSIYVKGNKRMWF